MKTLLAILATPGDAELIDRHWPYFRQTGWDILGVGTEDGKCEWPSKVHRLDIGVMGKKQMPCGSVIFDLVRQEIEIWKWFLDHPEYDSVCVMEPDNLILRKPPEHPGNGLYLITQLPNYARPGLFSTVWYASTPRWSDRRCTEQLYRHGREMFLAGNHEMFVSDRFPAHVCERHHIPWIAQPAWSPSANVWDAKDWQTAWARDAKAAIRMGCYCLHSVKHQWQLDIALEELKRCR